MKLSKKQVIFLIIICAFLFLLVFIPHLTNPFPIHIDEWHHITESIKLKQGVIAPDLAGARLGFHVFLAFLSLLIDLISFYQFLPAVWAVISALTLFFVTKKKTNSFFIAIFAMIFFASIKSNVNLTGLWFFTPLSFSIPFIFLYVYFFTEGIENKNKKFILISLAIMIFLLFVHAISVLFAIPFLIIYCLFYYKYLLKEYRFFSLFLIIPLAGILFFKFITKISFSSLFKRLFLELQFKHGWGVLEVQNSFFELYSLIGFLLAIIGLLIILFYKDKYKKYLAYAIWPLAVLAFIISFRVFGVSFLSPYQRNLYYFTISLPFLSSLGLFYIFKYLKSFIKKYNFDYKKTIFNILKIILIILILFFVFKSYFVVPENLKLYKILDNNSLEALNFLSTFPSSKIIAPIMVSPAVFPVSGHEPIGTVFFYGNREDVEKFFLTKDCIFKNTLIVKHDVSFVLSEEPIDCGWNMIYNKDNFLIYRFGKDKNNNILKSVGFS